MTLTHLTKGAGVATISVVLLGMLVSSPRGRAQDQDGRRHDEKCNERKIQIGFRIAPVPLNAANDCNFCHTGGRPPNFNFEAGFNPYFGQPKRTDPTTYLAGGTDFGPALPGKGYVGPDIISRNLTPDKTGKTEGGHTFAEFREIMRTGVDLDHLHPTCTAISPTPTPENCIPPPVDGNLLQVMPWPDFQDMTDHDLRAIYEYLSAIPCIAGPPAPSPLHNDCE